MFTRTVTVGAASGLHARPAMLVTQAAAASGARVTIARPSGAPVDASSILFVMGLDVKHGEQVELACDDEDVLDRLARMLATDLDAQ